MHRTRYVPLLVWLCVVSVQAQTLHTSSQYPLEAHIIKVEMRTGSAGTSSVYTDPTTGAVSGGGGGGTYTWHLMKAIIGDTLYGLSVPNGASIYGISVQHRDWLEVGTYPVKRVKNGFEFQYLDSTGKVRHEVLRIESEEATPTEEPIPATMPQTPESKTNPHADKLDYYDLKSGNDLLTLCSTPKDSERGEFDFAMCVGYILGVQDTLGELSASKVKTPFPLCLGANPPTKEQTVDIAVKFMRDNPAIRNEDAGAVAMGALSTAFTCHK
jgi:hypothetical protein